MPGRKFTTVAAGETFEVTVLFASAPVAASAAVDAMTLLDSSETQAAHSLIACSPITSSA